MTNNNIPKHWQLKKLGEVCEMYQPKTISTRELIENGKYLVYGANGVIGRYDEYNHSDSELLITCRGASCGAVNISIPYSWINGNAMVVKPKNENQIKRSYLAYFFRVKGIINSAISGSAQPQITRTTLNPVNLPIPPLPEQQAIVAKIEELLSELENGKKQLLTAQQQLKVYRQSLLKWAFEGKLTNKKIKDGELPKGWKKVKIEDIATVGTGATPLKGNKKYYDNGKIAWVTSGALNDEYVKEATDYVTELALKETNLSVYPKHTLLLAMYGEGKTRGKCSELLIEASTNQAIAAIHFANHDERIRPFLKYFLLKNYNDIRRLSSGGVQPNLNLGIVKKTFIPFPPIEEQQLIVSELESKLTVCDKIEETISQSLQQAETLRQSILKKAFEGKLVTSVAEQREAKVIPLYKPKNEYFYQMQLLGIIAKASKQKQIEHGEMTLAKYAYLMDKVYDIPTYYEYNRWHLGPYPPTIKKVINNKQYFKKSGKHIEVLNEKTLFNSTNPYTEKIQSAVNELSNIFSKYTAKERSHKTELLATVCKVIEDIQSTDLKAIRQSMAEWKINLKDKKHKTKAEKFNEPETEKCLAFIKEKGWDKKLMK